MPYRAKTKETNRWVKGYHFEWESKSFIINKPFMFAAQTVFEITHRRSQNIDYLLDGFIEVIPETVGRNTGLKDKNGKEIYGSIPINEVMSKGGDIVDCYKNAYHRRGEVVYIENLCGVIASFCSKDKRGFLPLSNTPEIEVIGTMADNPELLEEQKI